MMRVSLGIGAAVWIGLVGACGNLAPEVTPMMLAARSGDGPELKRQIASGKNVNALSRYGWTALMFASSDGHRSAAASLLDAGADPNIESKFIHFGFLSTGGNYPASTALREAIRNEHFDIANLLMDRRAEIEPGAIRLAGQFAGPAFLASLRRRGVDFNEPSVHAPPLLEAARHCNLPAVRWMLQHGATPNTVSDHGSVLESAVRGDCPEVVRYLLSRGANPNLRFGSAEYENTALFVAVRKWTDGQRFEQNLAIVSSLLAHGADRSLRGGGDPRTPLEIAEKSRAHTRERLDDPKTSELIRKQLIERLGYEETLIRLLRG